MTPDIATDRRANLIGSLWMVVAMAGFAVEDALLKLASGTLPIGQIMVLFGGGGAFVFACLASVKGEPLFVPEVVSPPMLIRAVFEVTGRLFYTLAIVLTPLSSATVILQATPIVVVAGATVVFGEKVGWRRWLAIFIGLIGVFVIIQPGAQSFSVLSLLALVGMIGFAGRDLASRAAPSALSTNLLGVYGFLAIVVAGAIYSFWQGTPYESPDVTSAIALAGAVLAGAFAYASLMRAMRTGEVSAVTPFRYFRLLFGVALGVLIFDESLSLSMIIGSCLIVGAGLTILWRGRQVANAANR